MADEQPLATTTSASPSPAPAGAGQAVPQPAPVIRPAQAAAPAGGDDPRARAAALRAEAAEIEAGLGNAGTVNVKVEPPHSELRFAGLVVTSDYTPVPQARLAALYGAAASAGVTLTEEG